MLSRVGEFLRNPSGHSAKDLQGFVYAMESHFKKPNTHEAQKEVLATFLQVALPDGVRLEYHTYLNKDNKKDTLENFMGFLQNKIDAEIRNTLQKRVFYDDKSNPRKGKVMSGAGATDDGDQNRDDPRVAGSCQVATPATPCAFCQGKPHPLFRCFQFASSSYEKKIQFVRTEGRCLRCLRPGHLAKDCAQIISCDLCENPFETGHNRLLHKDPDAQVALADGKPPAFSWQATRQLSGSRPVAVASMVLHLRCPQSGKIVAINALLDTGATDFILDTSIADRLSLQGDPCKYTVLGHAGHETVHDCTSGQIVAINPETKNEFQLHFYAYGGPCEGMFPEDWSRLKANWGHLKELDLPAPVEGRPFEAIIGCRYLSLLEHVDSQALHKGKGFDDPIAKRTPLGWMVAGHTSKRSWGKVATVQGLAVPASGVLRENRAPDYKSLYYQLKQELKRVWNLETEKEMKQLVNCHSPPIENCSGN